MRKFLSVFTVLCGMGAIFVLIWWKFDALPLTISDADDGRAAILSIAIICITILTVSGLVAVDSVQE